MPTPKNTPTKKKTARTPTPKKRAGVNAAKALAEVLEGIIVPTKASSLEPFSGLTGCVKCGFDGPILSRFLEGARHVRPNGVILEVEGEHLVRACQWCQRSWLERCKVDSPKGGMIEQHVPKPIDPEAAAVYG